MTDEQLLIETKCQALAVTAVASFTKAIEAINTASSVAHVNRLAWLDFVNTYVPGKLDWDERIALAQTGGLK